MTWDVSVAAVKEELPQFNKYLLIGYRQDQVKRFASFIDGVFNHAIELFHGKLEYRGYCVLSPIKRIQYCAGNNLIHGKMNIQKSELELLEFMFVYENQSIPVYLYVPYLHNGALQINDTKYYIQLAIIERMIYRVTDGVIIKVLRSPLQFWRSEQLVYRSTRKENNTYCDAVITVKAHYRKSNSNRRKTPLVLYLLAKYDFDYVLRNIFGLPEEALSFVEKDDPEDKNFL